MVLMILWQFDNSVLAARDSWRVDMRIETQMLWEQALQHSGRYGSKSHFRFEDQVMYCIDIVSMTQQNLRSDRIR